MRVCGRVTDVACYILSHVCRRLQGEEKREAQLALFDVLMHGGETFIDLPEGRARVRVDKTRDWACVDT